MNSSYASSALSFSAGNLAMVCKGLEGGHDMPEVVIRRRFDTGRHNFEHEYRELVDEWAFGYFDPKTESRVLIATGC